MRQRQRKTRNAERGRESEGGRRMERGGEREGGREEKETVHCNADTFWRQQKCPGSSRACVSSVCRSAGINSPSYQN